MCLRPLDLLPYMLDPAVTPAHAKNYISRVNDIGYVDRVSGNCDTEKSFWCSPYQGLSGSFLCVRLYDRGSTSCQGSGGNLCMSCHFVYIWQHICSTAYFAQLCRRPRLQMLVLAPTLRWKAQWKQMLASCSVTRPLLLWAPHQVCTRKLLCHWSKTATCRRWPDM